MSIGETLSRLLLKRLVDDVFTTGGVEPLDAVVDFLTRCGQEDDPRLTAALELAMQRAWCAVEAALSSDPSADDAQQMLRPCLERVLAELAHGGSVGDRPTALVVSNALRRQCLDDLRCARSGGALNGCLDREEWARSPEVFVRFAAAQVRPSKRRRTEMQLLRDLEHHGCVGLMRLLTRSGALPLLLMSARAFLCQELARLLYLCLQGSPEQTPDNCALVLEILNELSVPRFGIWRAPALRAKPVHWSRLERARSVSDGDSIYRFAQNASRETINQKAVAWWALVAVLAIAAALLVVLPVWMLVENAQRYAADQQRAALRRQRLRDERRRVDADHQRLIEEQRRLVRREESQRRALERQRQEAERRRQIEAEEERRRAVQQAEEEGEQQRRRLAEERRARLREEEQHRRQAHSALEDGLTQSALRQDREALTALNKAVRLDPHLHRAWTARGIVRRRLGKSDGALMDFHEAVRLDPQDVRAWLQCGELHAERREHHQAIDAFTAVLRLEPNNVSAYRQRGLCFVRCDEADKALADQTKAIELAPDEPLAYYHRADLHRRRNDLDRALDDYTAAIDRDRGSHRGMAPVYRERGMLYLHCRRYERAITDLTRALQLNPTDASVLRARCRAYLHESEWSNALLDAHGLIRHDAEDCAAYKLRGQAYLGLRDYRSAHKDFSHALRKGRDAETFYLRACAKVYLGDLQEAIFDCNDATALNPRLAGAFYLRGTLNLREGYRNSGLADCRTAHEIDPQFPLP